MKAKFVNFSSSKSQKKTEELTAKDHINQNTKFYRYSIPLQQLINQSLSSTDSLITESMSNKSEEFKTPSANKKQNDESPVKTTTLKRTDQKKRGKTKNRVLDTEESTK
jgi:hypothetical protein